MENKEKETSNSEESKQEEKQEESKVEESTPQETNANPQPSENGSLNEVIKKVASLKQELIDYIDLKFNNVPIAKVDKDKNTTEEEKKELPVW